METPIPLRDQVISKVKKDIKKKILKVNTYITEVQISEEMNISRTPVREALMLLNGQGILEKTPRKGYKIVEIQNKSKLEIYKVYSVLDSLAAGLAVDNIHESDLNKMNEYIDKMDIAIKYKNYVDYYNYQRDFHRIYINKCENSYLIKLIDDIDSTVINTSYSGNDEVELFKVLAESNDEHRQIVQLFQDKKIQELEVYLKNCHWMTKHQDLI